MKHNLQKWIRRFISFIFFLIVLIWIFFVTNDKKLPIITDIYHRSFDDTVFSVFSQKYEGTVIGLTILKNRDSMLLLNGVNKDSIHYFIGSFGDHLPEFWDSPQYISILYKRSNSDSFYLKRDGKTVGYKIVSDSFYLNNNR